jgi:hypothetical protein
MDVTIILVSKLQRRFPNNKIMSAMGMMYPQYWLKKDNYDASFLVHLIRGSCLKLNMFFTLVKKPKLEVSSPVVKYVKQMTNLSNSSSILFNQVPICLTH